MVRFIDQHRCKYGVEPICNVLPIAPSTYHSHRALRANPELRSARAKRDIVLRGHVRRIWQENYQVYGVRKVWQALHREDRKRGEQGRLNVARCTAERLMRQMGLAGAVRGKKFQTTIGCENAPRPADLVDRQFVASRPNQLWVSDLERHEAPLNRVVMKGHHCQFVAADWLKLRAA